MPRRLALLLATWLLASASAAPSTSLGPTLLAPELAGPPVTLAAGPDGSPSLNANATGSAATVTGTLFGATYNVTRITNHADHAWETRLVVTSTSGATASCDACEVRLVQGATTTTHIAITAGVLTTSAGAWVDLLAAGDPGDDWDIHLRADTNGLANEDARIDYRLEYRAPGTTSPVVGYTNMTAIFVV